MEGGGSSAPRGWAGHYGSQKSGGPGHLALSGRGLGGGNVGVQAAGRSGRWPDSKEGKGAGGPCMERPDRWKGRPRSRDHHPRFCHHHCLLLRGYTFTGDISCLWSASFFFFFSIRFLQESVRSLMLNIAKRLPQTSHSTVKHPADQIFTDVSRLGDGCVWTDLGP